MAERARGSDVKISRIGVLHHPKIPKTQQVAGEIADFVGQQGVVAWLASTWDEPRVRDQVEHLEREMTLYDAEELAPEDPREARKRKQQGQ